jgi:hypothetical protein
MLWKLWDILTGYLKDTPWGRALQPFLFVLVAGIVSEVFAYQFVRTQYGFSPDLGVFLSSYVSVRIAIVTGAALLLMLLLRLEPKPDARPEPGRLAAFYRRNRRSILYRTGVTLLIVACTAVGFLVRSPSRVSHITVRFMGLPEDVRSEALAYIIYELNRPQRQWHFDVDYAPFNELVLTSREKERCQADTQPLLCYAEQMAGDRGPIIAITDRPLNGAYFATHRGLASVITTADSASYAPLTTYEYLAYTVVVQSVLLHLDMNGGLPADAFAPRSSSTGDVFQFAPERATLKSTILAAKLSPEEESLIFNRFGPEYLGVCSSLISLDWLYSTRVRTNLAKIFGVSLSR